MVNTIALIIIWIISWSIGWIFTWIMIMMVACTYAWIFIGGGYWFISGISSDNFDGCSFWKGTGDISGNSTGNVIGTSIM